ncbi:hypothetical protein [Mycobacterium marinum]|uniref:hypothetical protein n=1 Tax=Mycobacterium marinum TaxID=1781 RepID=UPI001921E2C0|nr:hypothetical protein [Mycobacterium marinum]QQW33201.1 hypothetical protein HXW97_04635 [Mycobacterium marinum]
MTQTNISELPTEVLQYIVKLRKEAAQYRSQRNARQHDLEAADARIVELEAELAELKAGR